MRTVASVKHLYPLQVRRSQQLISDGCYCFPKNIILINSFLSKPSILAHYHYSSDSIFLWVVTMDYVKNSIIVSVTMVAIIGFSAAMGEDRVAEPSPLLLAMSQEELDAMMEAINAINNALDPNASAATPPPTPAEEQAPTESAINCARAEAIRYQGQPGFARPPECIEPAPVSTQLTGVECINRAAAIQNQWRIEGDQAGGNAQLIRAAEVRAQTTLRTLFTTTCAHHPDARTWVSKADMVLKGGSTYTPAATLQPAPQAANTSQIAVQCMSVRRDPNGNYAAYLENHCGVTIEAIWCVEGYDCRNGTWGMTNTWTIGAGRNYPITGARNGGTIHYFGCTGRNSRPTEAGPTNYYCK